MRAFSCFCLMILSQVLARSAEPFADLDAVTKNPVRWSGSKQELATLFNKERIKLGQKFVPELLKFIGTSSSRHYWCGCFLATDSYLHNQEPMPLLAISLWEQALVLEAIHPDGEADYGNSVTLHQLLTIEYERLGLHHLAAKHKAFENVVSADTGSGGGAIGEREDKLHDQIDLQLLTPKPQKNSQAVGLFLGVRDTQGKLWLHEIISKRKWQYESGNLAEADKE